MNANRLVGPSTVSALLVITLPGGRAELCVSVSDHLMYCPDTSMIPNISQAKSHREPWVSKQYSQKLELRA